MASTQKEALEYDCYATDVPEGERKHDGTSGASMETEAFDCNQYVGHVDTDVEAAGSSDTMASGDNVDSKRGGLVPVNIEENVEKREAFECDPCAMDFVKPSGVEAAAREQDGPMLASTRPEGFNYVSTVHDFRVSPIEQGIMLSSPNASKIEEEATSSSLEDVEAQVTVPDSNPHVKQEVTLTAILVSNQEESFGVACATPKIEDGKFVDSTFHDLEENQRAGNGYDIDFDIDAHDMPLEESFFDENSLFPALDADKTEAWHAGIDDVIMVEASAQAGSSRHHAGVDMKAFPGDRNNEPVALHDVEDDVVSKEDWLPDTDQQPVSETPLADALHGVEESNDLNNTHVQVHEELGRYPCIQTKVELLAFGVVQDKELACVGSKNERPLQYDTEEIFASLAEANVETVHDADTSKAKRLEEEVNTKVTLEENKIEPTPISMTHADTAVPLYELDQHMPGCSSVMDVEHAKAGDAYKDSSLESDMGHKEIVTQVEAKGKGSSLDFEKKDECTDMQSNEATAGNQLIVENNALPVDSSGALHTNRPSLILDGNAEPDFVPISSEQGESTSVIVCRETLMEAVLEAPGTSGPASVFGGNMEPESAPIISEQGESALCREISMEAVLEPLAQEEASTLEQNELHDRFAGNNNETQVGHGVLSHVGADALHVEPVQNQSSKLVVADLESVNKSDDDVPLVKNNDVKEICASGAETVEVDKFGEQEEKASTKEHEQSDEKVVDDFDSGLPKPSKIKLEEIHASGDEMEVVKVAEHDKGVLNEEQKQSDVRFAYDFDGTVQEMLKSVVEESLGSREGGTKGEVAIADQEKVAANEELEDDFDSGLLEPTKSELEEIHASGDEMEVVKIAELDKGVSNEEHKHSYGGFAYDFDGSVQRMQKSDVEMNLGSRDGVAEGEVAVVDQEKVAANEELEDDFDNGLPEPSKTELEEIHASGDEMEVVKNAEHDKGVWNEEQKQSDGGFAHGLDGSVHEMQKSNVETSLGSRDGVTEGEVAVADQEKVAANEDLEDDFDSGLPESSKSELEEIHGSGDEMEVVKIAEHDKGVLNEEQKQLDGEFACDFDGSVQEMQKSDVEASLRSRDGVAKGEVAVADQEKVAANEELEGHSLTLLAGTSPPQAESVEELKKQELPLTEATIHLPSSLDFETNVSSSTDFTRKVEVTDGPKNSEEFAALEQRAVPLEQSREVTGVSADASATKKSQKSISDDRFLKAEHHPNKANVKKAKEAVGCKYVGDHADAKCRPELEEEPIGKRAEQPVKQGFTFGIGDLVWAKVRSHPWWPAQIFDPADASKPARKAKKPGRVLVAFFGDCTFAWLQQSQMIAFRPNFKEKVQQTTMRIFCLAVEEALEELCRRSELGLSCKHFEGALHSTSSFPDSNTGIREGVRGGSLKNIRASAEMFRPKKTLEFVKNVAASPFGAWSSTLQWAESRGHAYGLRTCMVAMEGSDSAPVLPTPPAVSSKSPKLKRSYSSLDAEDLPDAGGKGGKELIKAKKLKSDKERKEGKGSLAKADENKRVAPDNDAGVKSGVVDSTDTSDKKKVRNVIKIKLSKMMKSDHLPIPERHLDTASDKEVGGERVSDDSKETLLAMASPVKPLKRSSSKEEKASSSSKKVRTQIGEESKNGTSTHQAGKPSLGEDVLDMDADGSLRTWSGTEDAFDVMPSPSCDRGKKSESSKMLVEVGLEKDVLVKDKNAGKSESARKLSKVGDSIRRVASELTGTPTVKVVDHVRHLEPKVKKKMKESVFERDASPVGSKAIPKEASEDVSLLQLRRDLELVAKKAGFGGAKSKAIKQSKKGGGQVEAVVAKSSPQWQSVPQRSQRSCVQELALAARKRKSEIVHDEVVAKLPKNSSTAGSQRHHASKGYITSAEKPGERRSYDKSVLLYSKRPAPPTSLSKSSSQRYDEKLSSHAPLGLFMRFPGDFPLPSEAQLKATFIPFGPLQMSATRIYKDSASAQVVFKHGRDAESALKHAKKNPMFGQVAVTYRLRHLSHSTKAETKTDTLFSNKTHSSQVPALKGSAPSREASLEKKGGDREVVFSPMLSPSNYETYSASEPTGDIQDQMMTLLRQVSVIVNTSPVTSDGT